MAEDKHAHGADCDCGCNHDHEHDHDHEHHEPEEYLHVAERFAGKFVGGRNDGKTVAVVAFDGNKKFPPFHQATWEAGEEHEVELILADDLSEWMVATGCEIALFTGCEPTKQEMLVATMARVSISGMKKVMVETTGIVVIDPLSQMRQTMEVMVAFGATSAAGIAKIEIVMDHRLEGEGSAPHMCEPNFNVIHKDDILRFIITRESDLQAMMNVINGKNLAGRCQLACVVEGDQMAPADVQAFIDGCGIAIELLEPVTIVRL